MVKQCYYQNVQYVIVKKSRFTKNQEAEGLLSNLGVRTPLSKSLLNRVCFARLPACVLTCLARLRAYVLGVLTCLRAYVLGVLLCLACFCAWRAYVLMCLRAYVLVVLACLL